MLSLLRKGAQGRALDTLVGALSSAGVAEAVLEHVAGPQKGSVLVPGFDAFSRSASYPAFKWLFPRPERGEEAFLYAYENFADRELGAVRGPASIAAGIYGSARAGYPVFGNSQRASAWWTPALTMVAVAQHLAEELVHREGDTYSAHVGPGFVQVSPKGCWSSFRKMVVPCARPPSDFPARSLVFSAVESRRPLALAVMAQDQELDMGALWALNGVIRALDMGVLTEADVMARLGRRAKEDAIAVKSAGSALEAAASLMERTDENLVETLYTICVPHLMRAADFRRHFGRPGQFPKRRVSTGTRRRWVDVLQSYAEARHGSRAH